MGKMRDFEGVDEQSMAPLPDSPLVDAIFEELPENRISHLVLEHWPANHSKLTGLTSLPLASLPHSCRS